MAIKSVNEIRSLRRGLAVLRALEAGEARSLGELHRALDLSKTTISRILVTLEAERLASQRLVDGKWAAGPGIGPADRISATHNLLVRAAGPELARLCASAIWPSDLSVRSGLKMVLVETSRPHTTLMFNKVSVGFEIDFLFSAPGRAYLAFCPDREREHVLSRLRTRPEYGILFESGTMERILDEVRAQNYGHRDIHWGGRSHHLKATFDDGLDAIAVPIFAGGAVLGCVNLIWIRSVLSRKDAVARYLEDLRRAAEAISAGYRALLD